MYQFNLEPLLNHRRYQVEVLQKELADLPAAAKALIAREPKLDKPAEDGHDAAASGQKEP